MLNSRSAMKAIPKRALSAGYTFSGIPIRAVSTHFNGQNDWYGFRYKDELSDIPQNYPVWYACRASADYQEWIWIPTSFAHGNFFTEGTLIEYFCSAEYSLGCEACISRLAKDTDWTLCDANLKKLFDRMIWSTSLISDKDRDAASSIPLVSS